MAADNRQQDTTQFTQIYSLAIPAGIKRDGTIFQNDQYTDGVWCRFQRLEPKKIGGYKTIFTAFNGIYRGMISIPYNGVNYIFAGTAETLDVFTTGTTYSVGSGPFVVNMLPGSVFANVISNTTTQVVVPGDATTTFAPGKQIILTQTGTPTAYTISTSTYSATPTPAHTTIVFSPAAPAGTISRIWLNDSIFTPDPVLGPYSNDWQFDAQFSPQGGNLACFAHPGKNLINIDSGILSQVLVGNVLPDNDNDYYFTGLCDSTGQNPTYKPISVDGGVCVLYPFIFVYGSHGFIANNNVDVTPGNYGTQNFYDWNGPFANQVNVASSKIVKGMPMRGGTNSPSGLFWATDSLIRVSFNSQAASLYWTYDIVSSQISIMSSNAVVEMDGVFFWMGVDRFYLYNGSVKVLPNDKNVNWLFNNLNYEQRQKVWATKVPRYNEIWFFYPRGTATECTDAIIYNVKDQLWYDAGSAVGARRSCGYTTELFPTPIWAGWEYNPQYNQASTVIAHPASLSAPGPNQFYLAGNQTTGFKPGSYVAFSQDTQATIYQITASVNIFNMVIGTPGVTLVTLSQNISPPVSAGSLVYNATNGYSIWQHEFGLNQVSLGGETAVYSSITTSDISWLTGSPSGDQLVGINRRMHLRRIEPNFVQSGTMALTILGRKFAGGQNEENSGPYYFTQDTGKIDLRVEHRLIRLQFVSNEIDGNFEMGRNLITAEYGDERP
jgi:hypothetical protein